MLRQNVTRKQGIVRGISDQESALALLNDAYGAWGDQARFRWRYDQYPDFRDDDVFSIHVDGEIAAFRRVFRKRIVTRTGSKHDCFVFGDTCVAPEHQGEGLYSRLHEATVSFCREQGADLRCTFNRAGNTTYNANLGRGWRYRTLPIQLRILSPGAILRRYAHFVLDDADFLSPVVDRVGSRVGISIGGERLNLKDLWYGETTETEPTGVYVPLPSRTLPSLVEFASSLNCSRAVGRLTDRVRSGTATDHDDDLTIRAVTPPIGADESELSELYEASLSEYDIHFERTRRDVAHMLSHPYLESVVIAERDDRIVGIAPLSLSWSDGLLEAEVLDVVARESSVVRLLLDRAEAIAAERGADAVVAITDHNPGPEWARIERQVMMWPASADCSPALAEKPFHIGFYDVV